MKKSFSVAFALGVSLSACLVRGVDLPDGYVAQGYLQSDGTAWIDTGYCPNEKTQLAAVFEVKDLGGDHYLFGSSDLPAVADRALWMETFGNGSGYVGGFGYGYKGPASGNLGLVTTDYRLCSLAYEGGVFTVYNQTDDKTAVYDGSTELARVGEYQAKTTFALFTRHHSDGTVRAQNPSLRIRRFTISEGGEVKRDLVPACRTADLALGMYDIQNNEFYENAAASGAFAVGIGDEQKSGYHRLAYLESTGTQFIDTGYVFKSKPRVEARIWLTSDADRDIMGTAKADPGCFVIDYRDVGPNIYYRYSSTSSKNINYGTKIQGVWTDCAWDNQVWHDESLKGSVDSWDFSANAQTFRIFKGRDTGGDPGMLRIAWVKMYDGDELVRDYIPAVVDGKIGLFDKCSSVIYENDGTGDFLCGPVVPSELGDFTFLQVTGSPAQVGDVSPSYGFNQAEPGKECECTAPAEVTAGGIRATLCGWQLYYDGVSQQEGVGSPAVITAGPGISELRWIWNSDFFLTVTNSTGGTVIGEGGWKTGGEVVELTAVTDDEHEFVCWTGDVPAGLEKSNPITFAVEKGAALAAEFATPVVKTVKADGTGDYETLEDGVMAMNALADGQVGELVLEPGVYPVMAPLVLLKPVTVRSSTGDPSDVVVWAERIGGDFPVFKLMAADSVLRGLTISNGWAKAAGEGGGVTLIAGTAMNGCRVVGCSSDQVLGAVAGAYVNGGTVTATLFTGNKGAGGWAKNSGSGVYITNGGVVRGCTFTGNVGNDYGVTCAMMYGGSLVSCTITNNMSHFGGYYGYGALVEAFAGDNFVTRCLIADNAFGGDSFAAVRLATGNTTLTVERSTVAFNHGQKGGGFFRSNGTLTVKDSVVWGNDDVMLVRKRTAATPEDSNFRGVPLANIVHCCSTIPAPGSVVADPLFVDAPRGDYRLASNSPAAGMGYADQQGDEPAVEADAADEVCVEPGDDLHAAIVKCREGGTVRVAAGDYPLSRHGLFIAKGISVLSDEGPEKTVLRREGTTTDEDRLRLVYIEHPDAVFGGFTLKNCLGGDNLEVCASAICARDGVVTNCTVRDCHIWSSNQKYSSLVHIDGTARATRLVLCDNYGGGDRLGALVLSGASPVVEDSIVSNQTGNTVWASPTVRLQAGGAVLRRSQVVNCSAGVSGPIGLTLEAGTRLENCVIAHNKNLWNTGGAIRVDGDNVSVVNCTVVGNHSAGVAAGGLEASGKAVDVVNTVFFGNDSSKAAANDQDAGGDASTHYSNCWFTTAAMVSAKPCEKCYSGDPKFVDGSATGLDFTPAEDSSLRDKGDDSVVFSDDAGLDVYGLDRRYKVIDIGAAEYHHQGALSCTYVFEGNRIPGGTVTFTASVDGAGDPSALLYRWQLDGGAWTEWSEDAVYAPVLDEGSHHMVLAVKEGEEGTEVTTDMDGVTIVAAAAVMHLVSPFVEGHVAVEPYATEETAATNLLDVVRLSGVGSDITIHPGLHPVIDAASFSDAVRIHGASGRPQDTVLYRPREVSAQYSILSLGAAGAWLDCVTVSNGQNTLGSNLNLVGSTASNCVIAASNGNAVYSDGGRLVDSLIRDCYADSYRVYHGEKGSLIEGCTLTANRQDYYGNGCAHLDGSRMNRCRIVANDMRRKGYLENIAGAGGCGANLTGGAVLENTLIAGNRSHCGGAVNFIGAGLVRNCTIVSNIVNAATNYNGNAKTWQAIGTGGIYINCKDQMATVTNTICKFNRSRDRGEGFADWSDDLAWLVGSAKVGYSDIPAIGSASVTRGEGCIDADPLFRRPDAMDYRLRLASPCLDTGLTLEGARETTDLRGGPRVKGPSVDMGCYECGDGLMLLVK